jgi:hypothetical protein
MRFRMNDTQTTWRSVGLLAGPFRADNAGRVRFTPQCILKNRLGLQSLTLLHTCSPLYCTFSNNLKLDIPHLPPPVLCTLYFLLLLLYTVMYSIVLQFTVVCALQSSLLNQFFTVSRQRWTSTVQYVLSMMIHVAFTVLYCSVMRVIHDPCR